jgi:predicted MPP superfamily phosphohydrolase
MEPEIPDFQEIQIRKSKQRRKKASKNASTRRGWFKKLIGGIVATLAGGAYLRFEANWLETTKKTVKLDHFRKDAKVKILHLSDLHLSSVVSVDDIDFALREGFQRSPDVMFLTGDFITGKLPDTEFQKLGKCLVKYASQVPTFATLGNHDGGSWAAERGGYKTPNRVKAMLASAKVNLLDNRTQSIFLKGQPIVLTGVGDYWSESCKPKGCLHLINPKMPKKPAVTVLLCHNPDAKELLKGYDWDLMLCGHTHGGQFKIPFSGYAPFAPVMDRTMTEGLHQWEGRQIHITRGVGNLYGIRLNCRPEISLLELVST